MAFAHFSIVITRHGAARCAGPLADDDNKEQT
jgi:hypothetical protein